MQLKGEKEVVRNNLEVIKGFSFTAVCFWALTLFLAIGILWCVDGVLDLD